MSRGKYLSLEEARKTGKFKQFIKEHPSEADAGRFQALLDSMTKGSAKDGRTSTQGTSGGYSGTRTRQGTSEDASD